MKNDICGYSLWQLKERN